MSRVRWFALVPLMFPVGGTAHAQECPALGTPLVPGLEGETLLAELRATYRPSTWLGYDGARDVMYTVIDNDAGIVTGRYTGYQAFIDPQSPTPRLDAVAANFTAEHTWPQSKGADGSPMRSDLHHLFPTYDNANGARGNHPFDEIPDELTDSWYRLTEVTATPLTEFLDEYSELDTQNPHPLYTRRFEPREDHKGDVARAMFYFYTVYRAEADAADPDFFGAQKDVLRAWHHADPAGQLEYDRTCSIATYQGGAFNPFVIDPTLVERAYFGAGGPTSVQFVTGDDVVREVEGTYDIVVSILGVDAEVETTVDLVLVGGTATNGVDIVSFSPRTLVFPAGSAAPAVATVEIIADDEPENDETLLFQLQNAQGGAGAIVGQPSELTLTVRDELVPFPATLWINEFHYDNTGTDTGEFVEVAAPVEFTDWAAVALTLYTGSDGTSYATYDGLSDFVAGSSSGGIRFYHVSTPGLQNGTPDGIALDYDGAVIQFLSYEGSFTAVGGPADGWSSEDVGVEEGSSSPVATAIALQGTGTRPDQFTWATGVAATPGAVNEGQTIDTGTPVAVSGLHADATPTEVSIRWRSAQEASHLSFHVQRRGGGAWNRLTRTALRGGPGYRYLDADVEPGARYEYRIEAVQADQRSDFFGPVAVSIPVVEPLRLQAGPNPARADLTLRYEIAQARHVELRIFDLAGRLVRTLEDRSRAAGAYQVNWDGRDHSGRPLAAGVYFARLSTPRGSRSVRVTLLR